MQGESPTVFKDAFKAKEFLSPLFQGIGETLSSAASGNSAAPTAANPKKPPAYEKYPADDTAGAFHLPESLKNPGASIDSLGVAANLSPFATALIKKRNAQFSTVQVFNGLFNAPTKGVDANDAAAATQQVMNERQSTGVTKAQSALDNFYKTQQDIKLKQADRTGYENAAKTYQELAGTAPQMPTRQTPTVSENQRLLAALAVALGLGGEGQGNVDLAMAPQMAANARADEQYKQDMTAYGAANNTWENQLKAAGAMMTNERQAFNDQQDSYDKQYGIDVRANDAEEKRLELALSRATTQQQKDLTNAVNDWNDIVEQAWKDGEIDEDERGELIALRENHLRNYNLTKDFVASLAIPRAQKSEARIKAEADRDLNYSKFYAYIMNEDFKNQLRKQSLAQQKELFEKRLKQNAYQFQKAFGLKGALFDWKQFVDKARLAFEEERLGIGWAGVDARRMGVEVSKYKAINDARSNLLQLKEARAKATDAIAQQQLDSRIRAASQNLTLLEDMLPKLEAYPNSNKKAWNNPNHLPLASIGWVQTTARSQNDFINPSLARDMFAGYQLTVGTAKTGHGELTNSKNPSRHIPGNAVDITHINGYAVDTPQGKKLADEFIKKMKSRGYKQVAGETGVDKAILWQVADHFNHIHISRKSDDLKINFANPAIAPPPQPGDFPAEGEGGFSLEDVSGEQGSVDGGDYRIL